MALCRLEFLLLILGSCFVSADPVFPSGSATFSHSNHDPKYNIEIHSTDTPYHPEHGQESLFMTDKDGQKYECFIPDTDESKYTKQYQPSSGSVTLLTDSPSKTKTPDDLLDALKDRCLVGRENWWHYEFCYKGKIRQLHVEDQKIVQEFVLGVYDENKTAAIHENSPDVSLLKDPRSKTAAQRYHAHAYTNGTACDLTNEPRETEVRFVCSQSNKALIQSVKEVSTCKYQLIVQCPALCKHPLFHEERPTWFTINCNIVSTGKIRGNNPDRDKQLAISDLIPTAEVL